MGIWTLIRFALITGILICSAPGHSQAQRRSIQDEGTEKRNYGDPIPGEDGQAPDSSFDMSLIEAAKSGGVAEARGAFLRGESVNSRKSGGAPALLIAAQSGNIAVLRFLLEKQANPDLYEKSTGHSPLIAAAQLGNDSMVRMLLSHKANPNHQDRQGETALIKAVRAGSAEVVRSLLGAGADVNATDYAGHTALWHAIDARHDQIAKMIEAAGGA
ncbi:MAG TPA: ankyrin repeat domain-containing protein [Alphaproteobacteria bacterium]|nr:ankyrin repeat domain-containing protein [Alphaproteobacteria bacterium]